MKLRTLSRVLLNISLSSSSSRHKSDKDSGDERTSHEQSSESHERTSSGHHDRASPEPSKRFLTTTFARSPRKPMDHGEAPPSAYRQQRLRRRATMDPRPISRPDAPIDPPQRSARPGQGPVLPPQTPAHPPQVPSNPPQTARLQRAARHTSLPPRPVRLESPSARPAQSPIAQSDRPSSAYSKRNLNSPSPSQSSFSAQPDALRPKQQHRIKRKPVPYHIIERVEDKNAFTCALEEANKSACFNDGKAEGAAGRAGTSKDANNHAGKPPVPPRSVRRATLASPMDYREYSTP